MFLEYQDVFALEQNLIFVQDVIIQYMLEIQVQVNEFVYESLFLLDVYAFFYEKYLNIKKKKKF